ncbi:MAG: MoaD/ThiS family protein [Anaerolineae bacterium]|nr:MoaD/ThiS family protein [Anaerolineae bacterium]
MASIKIPTPLREYAGSNATVAVQGATVGEALDDLTTQYPDLRPHLYEGTALRNFVNVFVGEDDIRFLQELDTPIAADARLRIIPAIAGGSATHARA